MRRNQEYEEKSVLKYFYTPANKFKKSLGTNPV